MLGFSTGIFGLTPSFYLTIMVPQPKVALIAVQNTPGYPLWHSAHYEWLPLLSAWKHAKLYVATFCSLVQYRTSEFTLQKVRKPLDIEEPAPLAPQLVSMAPAAASAEAGLQVAAQVREIRRARHLSQRQLASRMQVPRTYISKIENGKAIPTLGSLERLANALEVDMRQLVRDSRSRREEEVSAILSDPFLAEIASLLPHLDSLHRTLLYGSVRDMASGRRRTA